MEAAVKITGKQVMKAAGAVCLATGVVAFSAVVASGAAIGAVAEGFKSAKNTMQNILKKDEAVVADEAVAENAAKSAEKSAEENAGESTGQDIEEA